MAQAFNPTKTTAKTYRKTFFSNLYKKILYYVHFFTLKRALSSIQIKVKKFLFITITEL